MIKIYTSCLLAIVLLCGTLQLHRTKGVWQNSAAELNSYLFADSSNCAEINSAIYKQYRELLPNTNNPDSLQSALLYQLYDAIGYMDDFGVDGKHTSVNGNQKRVTFYSTRDNGYTLNITYTVTDDCMNIVEISGMDKVLKHPCLYQYPTAH